VLLASCVGDCYNPGRLTVVIDGEDLQKVKFLLCELTFSFAWLNEAEDAAVVAAAEDQIWVSLLNV
jgi:hypothetical protein